MLRIFQNFISLMLLTAVIVFSGTVIAEESSEPDTHVQKELDGELLLPEGYNNDVEKKCMTVCNQWGEDCILNPGTGSRKCRRVCKSFKEECF